MQIRRGSSVLIVTILIAFFLYACGGGGSDSSPAPPAPDVTTGGASSVTITGALLSGVVNPNGVATDAWFEWGTDNTLNAPTVTPSQPIGSGTTDNTVTEPITGLTGGTTYYYRAAASSSGGTVRGAILSFTTAPPVAPPSAQTLTATSVTTTSAVLNGTVIPNGLATNASFDWGTDNTLSGATSTPLQAVGSGTSSVSVNAAISGLSANTTYYFRIVAENSEGETLGTPIRSFTTPPNPPPTADAGPDQEIYRYGPFGFNTVTLDGSGSFDDYGTIESYEWTQLSGTSVALDDDTAIDPTFTVPAVSSPGENLPFQLTVTDDRAISDTDIVDINVLWGFLDDFSSDSIPTYNWYTGSGTTYTYMPGAENLRVVTGTENLYFDRFWGDVPGVGKFRTSTGVFSFDFYPRDKQSGGGIEITLADDPSTYYIFSTVTGEALKVIDNVVIDNVAFPTSYATYTDYPIKITFTPTLTVVEAFGQTVNMPGTDPGVPVTYFGIRLIGQDGDFDNFELAAIP